MPCIQSYYFFLSGGQDAKGAVLTPRLVWSPVLGGSAKRLEKIYTHHLAHLAACQAVLFCVQTVVSVYLLPA